MPLGYVDSDPNSLTSQLQRVRRAVLRGDAAQIARAGGVASAFDDGTGSSSNSKRYPITSKWQLLSQDVWEVHVDILPSFRFLPKSFVFDS